MPRLLLVSSSTTHGSGYLDHCEVEVRRLFSSARRVLFAPWALQDHDGYAQKVRRRFAAMEIEVVSLHESADPASELEHAEGLFVGGGNTFRLLSALWRNRLIESIRQRVADGMPYLGTSAGSNVACPSIKTTNDMPIVFPETFEALGLVPFQINPHYLDPDPSSTHMGETRDTRLAEFLEENATPVVALREGAMLRVEDGGVLLAGETGAKIFRRGAEPLECRPGTRLEALLRTDS